MAELTTIKKTLPLISNDFKNIEQKECTVKIVEIDYKIYFEYRIKNEVMERAAKLYPEKYMTNPRSTTEQPKMHSPIFRGTTFDDLKERLWEIANDLTFEEGIASKYGDKVLFIRFNGSAQKHRDNNYGAGMGTNVKMGFNFFVGFKLIETKKKWLSEELETIVKYSSEFQRGSNDRPHYKDGDISPLYHTEGERRTLEAMYLIIPYDEKIHAFLQDMENNFVKLINDLNIYLGDLTKEKLVALMENANDIKLLSSGK